MKIDRLLNSKKEIVLNIRFNNRSNCQDTLKTINETSNDPATDVTYHSDRDILLSLLKPNISYNNLKALLEKIGPLQTIGEDRELQIFMKRMKKPNLKKIDLIIEVFEKNKFKKEGSVFNSIILNYKISNNLNKYYFCHIYKRSKAFKLSSDQFLWMLDYISHYPISNDLISEILLDLSKMEYRKKMNSIVEGLIKNKKISEKNFNECLVLFSKKKTIAALSVKMFKLNTKSFFILKKKLGGNLQKLAYALGIKDYKEARLSDSKYKNIPKKIKKSFEFIFDPKRRYRTIKIK